MRTNAMVVDISRSSELFSSGSKAESGGISSVIALLPARRQVAAQFHAALAHVVEFGRTFFEGQIGHFIELVVRAPAGRSGRGRPSAKSCPFFSADG